MTPTVHGVFQNHIDAEAEAAGWREEGWIAEVVAGDAVPYSRRVAAVSAGRRIRQQDIFVVLVKGHKPGYNYTEERG